MSAPRQQKENYGRQHSEHSDEGLIGRNGYNEEQKRENRAELFMLVNPKSGAKEGSKFLDFEYESVQVAFDN